MLASIDSRCIVTKPLSQLLNKKFFLGCMTPLSAFLGLKWYTIA